MILVTGTKRSGTSMWMQILRAAGVDVLGTAFPKDWEEVLAEANPEGFYESPLRRGIYFRTNPDPRTGAYLGHLESRGKAVKVFIPGLVRSDMAFIEKVLVTMRDWREYHASLQRLYALEHANRGAKQGLPPLPYVAPTLEWWSENFALLSDALTRRYPFHTIAYESTLSDPATIVPEAIHWLGLGDAEAALAAVKPDLRTQRPARREVPDVEPRDAEVFDALYARVRDRRPLDAAFIDRLNETHERLGPRVVAETHRVRRERARVLREHRKRTAGARPPDPERSPAAGEPSS